MIAGLAPSWRARSTWPARVSAVVIGAAITAALGLPGLALMVAFFVIGSAVTKLGYAIKAARGIAQEKGGARGWRNAWANGGVAAFLALLAGASRRRGLRELLQLSRYVASVATAAADTCSSEMGKAYGRRTFLITTLRPVPPGTEGAVSLEGTLGGLAGGCVVAAVGAAAGLYRLAGRGRRGVLRPARQPGRERHRHRGGAPRLAQQRPAERAQHRDRRGLRLALRPRRAVG